jgi:ferredoxin
MRIAADIERCIGAGSCVLSAPEVFDQDDEGRVLLLLERPGDELRRSVQDAVTVCPAAALELRHE